jgi:aldehyde dehydrogenase (NAD+)
MAKTISKKKNNTIKLNFDTSRNYAPAPESKSAATINKQYDLFINGQFEKPLSKKYFDTINPANEEKLSEVAEANAADVNKAVVAARTAYEKVWKKMPAKERAKYIFRIARMVQEKAKELAIIETLDGGKPIRESRDFDVPAAANHLFYYAGWADKLEYAFPNRTTAPLGIAGQIIPWNFPLLMASWKIAPALATGNTVVLKPAETTPLTALNWQRSYRKQICHPGW